MKKLSEYTSKDGKFVHQAKAGRYGGSKPDVQKPVKGPSNKDLDKMKKEGLDEKAKPTDAALHKTLGPTKNYQQGVEALKKAHGFTSAQAKGHINRLMSQIAKDDKTQKEDVDEKLVGNQHKIDANKDGKITSHDFKKLRAKKKGETATMNPKMDSGKGGSMEQKETTVKSADKEPEAYTDPRTGKIKYRMVVKDRDMIKKESTIRQKLLSIFEKKDAHTAGATAPETMDDKLTGAGAKKMKADLQGNAADPDLEKKSHDSVSAAGRAGPSTKARPNDNMNGDKKVVNPVDDVTKKGTASSEVKEQSMMDKVLAYLRK